MQLRRPFSSLYHPCLIEPSSPNSQCLTINPPQTEHFITKPMADKLAPMKTKSHLASVRVSGKQKNGCYELFPFGNTVPIIDRRQTARRQRRTTSTTTAGTTKRTTTREVTPKATMKRAAIAATTKKIRAAPKDEMRNP